MKTTLTHLLPEKQEQVLQVVSIIKEVVAPEMIILYGSYAKGKYVDDNYMSKGLIHEYISDMDFLVVTRGETVNKVELEGIIRERTSHYRSPVSLEIYDIDYINTGLEYGQYFFTDIVKEGILLYDTDIVHFAQPKEQSPAEQKQIAQQYFDIWFKRGNEFLNSVNFNMQQNALKLAAFELHQATESYYYTMLLVFTGYKKKTHNLYTLRKTAKSLSTELFLLFPIEKNKSEAVLFDLLKRAYIEARYDDDYSITEDELKALQERINEMKLLVEKLSLEKINSFE